MHNEIFRAEQCSDILIPEILQFLQCLMKNSFVIYFLILIPKSDYFSQKINFKYLKSRNLDICNEDKTPIYYPAY